MQRELSVQDHVPFAHVPNFKSISGSCRLVRIRGPANFVTGGRGSELRKNTQTWILSSCSSAQAVTILKRLMIPQDRRSKMYIDVHEQYYQSVCTSSLN